MTSLLRLSGLTAITLTAALSMTAGLAIAGDNNVSADQIVNALQPSKILKPVTRGLSAGPQVDPAVKDKEISFIQTLRNRKTRSLSLGEREEVAQIASTKPNIDLDIQFDYNSAVNQAGLDAGGARNLGKALLGAKPQEVRPSWSPVTPMRSAAKPIIRISPSAAPIRSSAS